MKGVLTCQLCGRSFPLTLSSCKCKCGGTLLVSYDMERAGYTLTKQSLFHRPTSMWRYHELLPLLNPQNIVSLGEGWTPLIRLRQAEQRLSIGELWIKREEQNPTGSFKARGMSAAISMAKEHGIRKVAVNSNGNAASALAAYAGAASMEAHVFLPKDCPNLIIQECLSYGAQTYLVDGLIHDAGSIIDAGYAEQSWHHVGTMREPGRIEGKKTMGFELAEQMKWHLPDVIVYPTGGGSGLIGMWQAFQQLKELGFIEGDYPRMVSVQEEGCQPLVDAIADRTSSNDEDHVIASGPTGLRVPFPPDIDLLHSIIKRSGGTAIAVSADDIQSSQQALGQLGISASPEGAATWAGLNFLLEHNWIRRTDRVVLFNTCHALKYLSVNPPKIAVIQTYQDWKVRSSKEQESSS